jgi:thiol-disulfide isomerase/thioredoxin
LAPIPLENPVPTRTRLLTAVLLAALLTACGKPDYHTLDGGSGRFADHGGRWFLINYWAEWCKPCITELPELNEFQLEYGAQATVFAVNFDGVAGDTLAAQVEKLGIAIPVMLADPAPQLGYERPVALPSTFVFGPDGKLRQVLRGPQTVADLAAAIGQGGAPAAAETQP